MTNQPQGPYQDAYQAPYPSADPNQPPVYYAPVYPEPKGKSVASMVLGIVSLVCGFVFILPIIGVILGAIGMRSEPTDRGIAIAGLVMNLICLAGWIIIGLIIILGLIGFWAASSSSTGALLSTLF
jgi:hypothetical protein